VVVLSNGTESPSDRQFKFADFGLKTARVRVPQDGEAGGTEMQHASTYSAKSSHSRRILSNNVR
jgi:hypothetical protein